MKTDDEYNSGRMWAYIEGLITGSVVMGMWMCLMTMKK
jgi:hypothetical protein